MQLKSQLIWLLSGTIAAIAVGWVAALIHASGHAPIGLVSLGVGALLGAALFKLAAMLRVAGLWPLILGTLLLAIVTIAAEHAWLYRDFCGQWQEARMKSAAVAMFRDENPPSPRVYFTREVNARLWLADAAMISTAAVGVVMVGRRYWR
jgi:hypothetical protein